MARSKQFKAESKRLLDLMINSIYTNKEIFLRELLSNASDAADKLYFKSLEDASLPFNRADLKIEILIDEANRTLTIRDNGIGMNPEELESYLGTIAKSDSHAFKEAMNEESDDIDVIGQFGVGFYSAFMVSSRVEVISKAYGNDEAACFASNGLDGYTIRKVEKAEHGTDVILTLKENTEDEDYDQYLKEYKIKQLVETYSDYIRYPIVLGEDTLNSMVPIWKRSKQDVSEEELHDFYKHKFHDFEAPLKTVHMQIEGNPSFDALLFIPKHVPMNFYSNQYEPGLQLYSRGVFIMEHNTALIPDHFRFVRGLVDSPDLSLNISREILQHDRQLKNIASRIEKRIQSELEKMLKNDRDSYVEFWNAFGTTLKFGIYAEFGAHKEKLQDLILFHNSNGDALITLKEYIDSMKEDQEHIYYVSGESVAKCSILPQTEYVKSKGYPVLYLTDDVDEFMIQVLNEYDGKAFKSISQGDLDLGGPEEKEDLEKQKEATQDIMEALKEALKDSVDDVTLSSRLVTHPVCLVSEEGLSFEMEKVLNAMPDKQQDFKAKRILEINPKHPLLKTLETVYKTHPEALTDYAYILYNQACLIEGLPIEDPIAFSQKLAQLMIDSVS